MLKRFPFFCGLCSKTIDAEFFAEHLIENHLNYKPFKCGEINCFGEFSTERSFNAHCSMKHDGVKNMICFGNHWLDRTKSFIINAEIRRDPYKSLINIRKLISSNLYQKCGQTIVEMFDRNWLRKKHFIRRNAAILEANKENVISACCENFLEDVIPEELIVSNEFPFKPSSDKVVKAEDNTVVQDVFQHLTSLLVVKKDGTKSFREPKKKRKINPRRKSLPNSLSKKEPKKMARRSGRLHHVTPPSYKTTRKYFKSKSLSQDCLASKELMGPSSTETSSSPSASPGHRWLRKINCRICKLPIINQPWTLNRHSLKHIQEITNIDWLCECSICKKDGREMKSIYRDAVIGHIRLKHLRVKKEILTNGKHFFDRSAEFTDKIEFVQNLAFPPDLV